ncbi:MAG: FAD-binding oxidoreductase [Desulfovibrionales bacterium]
MIFGADSSRLFAPPWAVVRPRNVEQVQSLLAWAQEQSIPLFPRARGTNMAGCVVPRGGGIVISSLLMDKVLEIGGRDFLAITEPGVITAELQKQLTQRNLFYPPDPASVKFSTIGGNVATNAGGMRAVKYGVTRDYVLGLEAVLPGGEIIRTGGRCHKNVVGLDLTSLLVGSEGTLAFVTKIWLKLLPLPQASGSLLLVFRSLDQAIEASDGIAKSGVLPVTLELLTHEVLQAIDRIAPVPWPEQAEAVLLVKVDGTEESVRGEMERVLQASQSKGLLMHRQGKGEEQESLWELRRLVNPASFQVRPDKMSEDICVPRGQVLAYLEKAGEISQKTGVPILTFGHLGDGNIHTNIMFDHADEKETKSAKRAKELVMSLVLDLRGTLSGEHGVGLTRRPYVGRQLGSSQLSLMRGIKGVFDPCGIMNPGKGF